MTNTKQTLHERNTRKTTITIQTEYKTQDKHKTTTNKARYKHTTNTRHTQNKHTTITMLAIHKQTTNTRQTQDNHKTNTTET